MWEIDNLSQLLGFLYSSALGCVYCAVYDIFRAVRAEVKCRPAAVFFQDIFFSAFCAVSCFCFLLSVTGGEMRAFVLAGAALGFFVFRFTASRLFFLVFKKTVRALNFLYVRLCWLLRRFFAFAERIFDFLSEKIRKILKFFLNTLKKGLKKM